MIKTAKEIESFLYLSLATIVILFFSVFFIKFHFIPKTVLGEKIDSSNKVGFWQDFLVKNPNYFEGWMELYNYTGDTKYLLKAKEIDPNR